MCPKKYELLTFLFEMTGDMQNDTIITYLVNEFHKQHLLEHFLARLQTGLVLRSGFSNFQSSAGVLVKALFDNNHLLSCVVF